MRGDRRSPARADKKAPARAHKRSQGAGASASKKSALLEEAITHMNAGRYGRSSSVLKELLALDPANPEAKRLFATLQLRLGSLVTARNAFQALTDEALERQDYWLAESLLREYLVAGPRCVPFVEKLGSVFELKGDVDAAIEEYAKAVEILVEDPDSEQPDLAAQLVSKITQLSPRNPVLLHLDSLLQRAKERPREAAPAEEDSGLPRFAPAMSGLDQPVTDVEFRIPPADAVSDPRRARLPWEEEAEDILVPQQPTADQETEPAMPNWNVAERHSQSAEIDAPPVSHEAQIATTSPLPPDQPAHLSAERASSVAKVGGDQPEWSALSRSDSAPSADHPADQSVTTAVHEEVPAAGVGEAPGNILDQSVAFEQSTVQLESPSALAGTGEESLALAEVGSAEALDNEYSSPASKPGSPPTSGGLTATEESPSIEIPSRSEGSESERSIAAVSPPMPWEQVEEIRPETTPVEAESRLVVEEVNENLITGILQQIDLRERLAGEPAGTTIHELPDHSHAPQPALLPEPEPALDTPSPVSTGERDDAAARLMSHVELPPRPNGVPEVSVAIMTPYEAPPSEPEERVTSSAAIGSSPEQPAETIPPVTQQSGLPDVELRLAVPQEIGADPAFFAEAGTFPPVKTQEPCVKEEDSPDSSSSLHALEEPHVFESRSNSARPGEISSADDLIFPEESPSDNAGLPVQEAIVARESIGGLQIGSAPQTVPGLDEDPAGYSEPEVVEEANSLTLDEEGTAASTDLGERSVGHSNRENSQPGVWEQGQSVELSERPSEAPPIFEERALEPPVSPHRLAPPFDGGEHCEEPQVAQSWHEPLSPRSEPEEPASSSVSSETTAKVAAHFDEPLPAVSASVVDASKGSVAAVEPSMDATPTLKDSRVQIAEPRKPISTVGLNESAVRTVSRPVTATLSRLFFRIALFIRSCFATAHAVVVTLISLMLFFVGCAILLVGGLGLVWLGLEETPNSAFQDLVGARPQFTEAASRNGALFLLGFAAPESKDPIQAGLAIQNERADLIAANGCLTLDDPGVSQSDQVPASALAKWYHEDIPSIPFRDKATMVKDWTRNRSVSMTRYQKWLTLPFDDTGYGQAAAPDCRLILDTHRLFVAEGFAQGHDQGVERIETDIAMWRGLLRKAKTLGTKLLAVAAVTDDARVVSGLLTMPELDARYLPRLAKLVSPMDSVEQSLRWPMQHEFLLEKKRIDMALRTDRQPARPWYLAGVALMPLPDQRILNNYADYYENLIKSVETARTMPTLPSSYVHIRTPAAGMLDYLLNPVNNLLEVSPGPAWEQPVGRIRETDALLRLTSLQASIRRGVADGDVRTRVAKAGHNFYDPFTGYPMLINPANNRLYSVGANGKDDDADPQKDVSVRIPPVGTPSSLSAASAPTLSSR
ncbi:MAG TPA: tetratricopeptide repeat protein [Nitrospiraceae bacterium]|nr:tetratricopeptide repeat protein [Nitrospiraceae bacterium]